MSILKTKQDLIVYQNLKSNVDPMKIFEQAGYKLTIIQILNFSCLQITPFHIQCLSATAGTEVEYGEWFEQTHHTLPSWVSYEYILWSFAESGLHCVKVYFLLFPPHTWSHWGSHWDQDKMGNILQMTYLKAFSFNQNCCILIKIWWNLFLSVQLTIFKHLVLIMAWCQSADKSLSEALIA